MARDHGSRGDHDERERRDSRDRYEDERDMRGDSAEYDAYDSAYDGPYDNGRALAPLVDDRGLDRYDPAGRPAPMVIPGTGVSMGEPFIKRRERPLTMRLAVLTVVATLIVTGLMSVTPLGAAAQPSVSSFEALAGALVMTKNQQYTWYTAQWGDSLQSLATKFSVQVGGIMQLNSLCPGQELQIGTAYKIPTDGNYGSAYQQQIQASGSCNLLPTGGAWGTTVFGTNWWNARAGDPGSDAEIECATSHGDLTNGLTTDEAAKFNFIGPNPGSSWVRGYSWYHDGVDIAAQEGNPIKAVQAGQIIWAGYDGTNGFGWSVVINHCYHVSTLYGHMMGLAPGITIGANIDQGTVIGYEGSTGWSTGPHLHISVMVDNNTVDPMLFYNYDVNAITH